jgi:hypothetical protein
MLFQYIEFGDPLAFLSSQQHWQSRGQTSPGDKWRALVTLEPFRAAFDPSSPAYWRRMCNHAHAPFSLQFANPVYFLFVGVLVAIGARKRWLTPPETLLAGGLLIIPYLTKSYENIMVSHARFSAVVLPGYLVLGQILWRIPGPLSAALLAFCAFLLGAYAGMFVAWHNFL